MSKLSLARLEFAITVNAHFLFVALTFGLATLVAIMETRWVISGNPVYGRMTRFWGRLYVVNYAVGIITGIVMEFQFGLNWAGLTHFAGNVFGAPLAIETLIAFFAEATFLGMWIFGWEVLPRWVHLILIWMVVATAFFSAFWILVDNSFLQHPVGAVLRGGTLHIADFGALLGNRSLWLACEHVLPASLAAGGLFVASVSAFHFVRRTAETNFFRRSLRLGLPVAFAASVASLVTGKDQFAFIGQIQPLKADVFSKVVFGSASHLAADQHTAALRYGPGSYVPPVLAGDAAKFMLVMWALIVLVSLAGTIRLRVPLYVLVPAVVDPFLGVIGGRAFRESGRQPWAVYGLLRTRDAISPSVSRATIPAALIIFGTVLASLAVIDWTIIGHLARRGPDRVSPGPAGNDASPPPEVSGSLTALA